MAFTNACSALYFSSPIVSLNLASNSASFNAFYAFLDYFLVFLLIELLRSGMLSSFVYIPAFLGLQNPWFPIVFYIKLNIKSINIYNNTLIMILYNIELMLYMERRFLNLI